MSWSYLPEPEAESTEACCSDTLPFAPSRLSTRIASCCCNDSATACSQGSRCGTTFARSTATRGEELSTSCPEGSPAPTSAPQEKAPESTASSPDSGEKWRASFARFDRDSSSWKTAQCSLLGDSDDCSVIWPRSGMTVGGLAYPLPTAARRTSGTESGFSVPTPKASDADKGGRGELLHYVKTGSPRGIPTPRANDAEKRENIDATNPRNGLAGFVRKWPTPTATDWKDGRGKTGNRAPEKSAKAGLKLGEAVRMIPTPSATDWKGSAKDGQRRGQLTDPAMGVIQAGGQLNPEWVEWLQGWPIGSTAFSPLAMDRFHEFMRQHGCCLPANDDDQPHETAKETGE